MDEEVMDAPAKTGEPVLCASGIVPRRGWDFVSAGRGDVPWGDAFRTLTAIGYDGPISIEWEDAGMDRLQGAPEALQALRRFDLDPSTTRFDAAFEQA